MQPPHEIARDFVRLLASGRMNGAIRKTLGNAAIAFGMALAAGISFAALLHGMRALRSTLDPLFATLISHPLAEAILTELRDKETPPARYRRR